VPPRTETVPARPVRDGSPAAWVGEAFGLRLESELPAPGLVGGRPSGAPATRLRRVSAESIANRWREAAAERLLERRRVDGSLGMSVAVDRELGYHVDAPGFGCFLVSRDGMVIECAPAPGSSWRWCRPLFAQALPLAAVANGVELLHASAVDLDGRVLAFAGPSGAGKTSLAVHMVDRGATLIADDALALAPARDLDLCPGPRFANVAEEQFEALSPAGRDRLGRVVGRSDKLHLVLPRLESRPRSLSALYLVHRSPAVEELAFERLWPPDPRSFLSATSLPHVAAPARLATQIEVCSRLARTIPCFRLLAPADVGPQLLSGRLAEHAASS
jgi:hypothetical protein